PQSCPAFIPLRDLFPWLGFAEVMPLAMYFSLASKKAPRRPSRGCRRTRGTRCSPSCDKYTLDARVRPMWRKLASVMVLGTGCAAASAELARAQAPNAENVALPPEVQPTITSSVPALAGFKKALSDLGYNFQLNYTGDVLGNPTGGVKQGATYE